MREKRLARTYHRELPGAIAMAAAVTAGLAFTCGFLGTAGFPRLPMFAVWLVLCGATGVLGLVRKLMDR